MVQPLEQTLTQYQESIAAMERARQTVYGEITTTLIQVNATQVTSSPGKRQMGCHLEQLCFRSQPAKSKDADEVGLPALRILPCGWGIGRVRGRSGGRESESEVAVAIFAFDEKNTREWFPLV